MAEIRVRARAVDMLGRQQIAGIPNAIHELFKNAHDAYAEHVEVDFFRRTRLLVLRDDGLGMTRQDVEGRWLTLGTESRIGANAPNAEVWTGRKKLPRRVVMGEKGIGRLAVAVIAPLTLLLTRAERKEGLHDLVAVLVHWGLFEAPGVDLGQIHIPIRTFPGGTLPDCTAIQSMAGEIQENIQKLNIPENLRKRIMGDLAQMATIAPERLDENVNSHSKNKLSLKGDKSGTWFIVTPTVSELEDDIDTVPDKGDTSLRKILLGFANTMDDKHIPVIDTEFRDHKKDGEVAELIGGSSFFTNGDFGSVDHLIDGRFDEFGQFKGTISVYRKEPRDFVCNWPDGKGRMSRCGPFSLKIGYVMGNQTESLLDGQEHGNMIKRLDKLGGLYIYRDGVRILPYGNWDNDFLSVEHRRTLSAADWFYSFRRMFGYISISHSENSALTEKAGREGFRENMAYRDFRSIAESLFKETAVRFFREASPLSDDYWDKKKELKREAKLLERLKKKADERRADFQSSLRAFRGLIDSNHFELKAIEAQERYETRLDGIDELTDPAEVAEQLLLLENDFREEIRALDKQLTLQKPRGLALTKTLQKEWDTYERLAPQIRARSISKLRDEIGARITETAQRRIDAHRRREAALEALRSDRTSLIKELSELKRRSYELSDRYQKTLKEVVREEFGALHDQLEMLIGEFGRNSASDGDCIDKGLLEASDKIELLRREETEALRALIRQLEDALDGLRERVTVDDRTTALEEKVARLEETLDFQAEFFQVGMTVGILGHEFEKAAATLREGLHELKRWADANVGLKRTYEKLKNSYEHLESYLKLLDPLGRRMHTRPVDISGAQIINTISRTFSQQMETASITLNITPAFRDFSLRCRASALLGAIVNIVDNAIYWVKRSENGDHRIVMDADETGLLISNSGPGISVFDAERIFEFGFTTKPGGRGMGLAVSRDVLAKEGLILELLACGQSEMPIFRIRPEEAE